MDTPLHPPVRLQPVYSQPVNVKDTQRLLESFIDDFQERSSAAQGGNTAVTVQLQKLRDALQEEPKMKE
ncbi:hypothetical protein J132_06188 [Termitomyces sp. J132]|nr:hypothetical protein J132_06188 [Termitomyces sp. J132]